LADDLNEEGYPRPNVTRLHENLVRSRSTIKGRRPATFQIDVRRAPELENRFGKLLGLKTIAVRGDVLPSEMVAGTRLYLERLVRQINGTYETGSYDACAVLCRRLMESLLIEIYIFGKRPNDIQQNGVFFMLDRIITHVRYDAAVVLSRNSPKTMEEIKDIGDTAAHDRVYITQQRDIDEIRVKFRHLIEELLLLAGIKK
jgi:hypothetical protein